MGRVLKEVIELRSMQLFCRNDSRKYVFMTPRAQYEAHTLYEEKGPGLYILDLQERPLADGKYYYVWEMKRKRRGPLPKVVTKLPGDP